MKDFEQYATFIEGTTGAYEREIADASEKVVKILNDWRYSDKGKDVKRQKEAERLKAVGENFTNLTKEAVFRFLKDFRITVPADGQDHSRDIDNALRVIQTLGNNIDERNIINVLEPLRGDFRSMKYVLDVLDQKCAAEGKNAFLTFRLSEYLGITDDMLEYMDSYEQIAQIASDLRGYSYTIEGETSAIRPIDPNNPESRPEITYRSRGGSFRTNVNYELYALPDRIRKAGELYAKAEGGFANLSKPRYQSDNDILKTFATH